MINAFNPYLCVKYVYKYYSIVSIGICNCLHFPSYTLFWLNMSAMKSFSCFNPMNLGCFDGFYRMFFIIKVDSLVAELLFEIGEFTQCITGELTIIVLLNLDLPFREQSKLLLSVFSAFLS